MLENLACSNQVPTQTNPGHLRWPLPAPVAARLRLGGGWLALAVLLLIGVTPARAQLPAGWSDTDIGAPSLAGSAAYSAGDWSVSGGGADIWNAADQFHYAYENSTVNAAIIARVTAVEETDPWTKAGVMFRDSTDAGAMFAMVVVTPANGVNFQWRDSAGGQCGYSQVGGFSAPLWVKLERFGSEFAGYYSSDGVAWSPIGPSQTVPMVSAGLVGLAVTAHNDAALSTSTFTSVTISNVTPPAPLAFGIYREKWTGLNGSQPNTLDVLTNTAYNPNWPNNPDPSYTRIFDTFETEVNAGNYYGQRLRTLVVPSQSGYYVPWISSDDCSALYLSSDETPANRTQTAWVSAWTNSREWSKEPNQQGASVFLEAGRRYYLEALMQEGSGGDNLAVRWQMPDGSFEEPLMATSPAGTLLIPYDGVDLLPGIYTQTGNTNAVEGTDVRFSVLVTNRSSVTYQWRLNGANLPGVAALKPFYTVSNLSVSLNNGQVYSCRVANSSGSVTSAPVVLTVAHDTVLPTVVSVANLGTTNVQVVFSEAVEFSSSTSTANYVFTNGVAVTGASLGADKLTVTLITAPLVYGSNYTIVINKVRDRASTPNTIASNTKRTFLATTYAVKDIGNPGFTSVVTPVGNGGADVTAAGSDIGGNTDQCSLLYQLRSGDFDISARVAGISLVDVWAKAGLMARETLDANSRFAAILTTPAMNGSFFESRSVAGGASSSSGSFPANFPNTYVRLKRAGNTFTGYASYDGQTWSQLGTTSIVLPSQIYFGFVVSSHNSTQPTTVQFRDQADVTGGTIATVTSPREPLGPSSRKTPIAISEIMYKPAARADTNNTEFIELYNSNPWFQDISGYRLVGDNMSYTFPAGTVMAGGSFLVVAASPQSMQDVYGLSGVKGPYAGSLKASDTIHLLDEQGAVLLTLPYSNVPPWPAAADGAGHSLVLANPTYGEESPHAWDVSDVVGGSPGQLDTFHPSPLRDVVINEILAHTDLPEFDYVELYNHANQAVDISGCILTDDLSTNKFVVPSSTLIPARGFLVFSEFELGFRLNATAETVCFKNPDQSRFLDTVRFSDQENGVATGRWPNGAGEFYRLSAKSPGASNAGPRLSDIVINELMYDPISGDDDAQYVELYNRSANTINLAGWQLSDAINFSFQSNTVMKPGDYLVVARNTALLRTNYPNLNLTNCLGNFSGRLSHNGEHLALTMPDTITSTNELGAVTTNKIHIVVNDVTYGSGGRWGQWSAGGGSSLELKDPNSNNRLAANWADSDETQKSAWTNIEATGVLDLGANYESSIAHAQIGQMDVGECLVDNLEVRAGTSGPNLVANSDFESGLGSWLLQGDHCRSSLENTGYSSSHSLHIRSSSRVWTGANSCQVALTANSLAQGQTATLRFKARWLRGWPEVLFRLNGNWLEATGPLPVPANLGTPGARNSRHLNNVGPAIYQVTHTPALPGAGEPAVATARVHDQNGVQSLTLNYRIDPSTSYTAIAMKDDGTGGDAIAGDGLFSATIPGQGANTVVAFYLSANDNSSAASRFPALVDDFAPVRECVVMFGDSNPAGSFGVYHLWITQTNATRWSELPDLSNEAHDCTFATANRVIYNAQARFAGSPYHQGFDTPSGNLCHYKWIFPEDDVLLGATSFNKIHQPGNGAGDDASIQREQLANTFLRTLGVPWLNRRYVVVYVNGNRRGTLMEDTQTPDGDVVKEHFPNDSGGWLYKMQPWFEFGPDPSGSSIPFNNASWCNLMPYTTTGGVKKPARYRYNFLTRRTPVSANDFTNVFSLVDAASSYGTPNYVANMENLADMENWMRVFAANHAAGNWDSFGANNAQNLYGYVGTQGTKYSLLMFDFNIVIGNSGSWGPGQNLFSVNGQDSNVANIYNAPAFRRMYWRALQELVSGPLDVTQSGPLLDAKFSAFAANGLTVENPNSAIRNWLTQARNSIALQIAAENAGSFTVNPTPTISNDVAIVTGVAPVNVKTIWINGVAYPVTWTSVTGWRVVVPLQPGSNSLSVVGVDIHGVPVPGASGNVTPVYGGSAISPVGQVVINEIMYNPPIPGAEFVELYNSSSNHNFDLSDWKFNGLSYAFPSGSLLAPNSFLTLAANSAAFAAAYGATTPVFGNFGGALQNNGETLTLIRPGTNSASDLVVAKVRYGGAAPWPATSVGSALQLIDPRQDNWRVGNWAAATATNAGYAPAQWVFVTTNIPATSSRIYLYLGSAGDIYLDDFSLVSGGGPNLLANGDFESPLTGAWTSTPNFSGSAVSSTEKHSGASSLHMVATAAGIGSGNSVYQNISPALTIGNIYTLSFWYRQTTNGGPLTVRLSSSQNPTTLDPAPPWFVPQSPSTPGGTNSVVAALTPFPPLWINELQANNLTGITNSAGQRTPWIELYNPGTEVVPLAGLYLANNYSNLTQWVFPAGAVINPGQFKVIFTDGQTGLSTLNELHTSFVLSNSSGGIALSRLTNAQLQVLDFVDYANVGADHSYGSFPDGQSFDRAEFAFTTPGGMNDETGVASSIQYNVAGSVYTQNFDSLPDPGVSSINSDNPVTINGVTYSLSNPYDFAFPVIADGEIGGLGLAPLAGWYGLAGASTRFGATSGDQTTGGQISFGLPSSNNRALGLLATSSTGATAFGAKFINNTAKTLNYLTLQVTGEVWRQSDKAKTLQCSYLIDPSAMNAFPTNFTALIPALDVNFATVPSAVGGTAVDGTSTVNQTNLSVSNYSITNWPPGTALWIVWEMADPTGKAQGLAIDNLSFSANATATTPTNYPPVLDTIPNSFVILGQTLSFTAHAIDPDQPPQSVTFTLDPGAPANASINATTGAFSWTPTAAQVLTTNLITIRATDNGAPPLNSFRSFTATVLNPPSITVTSLIGHTLTLGWPSVPGKTYRVQYRDDLATGTWITLGSDLPGTGNPLSISLDASSTAKRFCRILILP